jgi:hypothetical protein
VTSPSLYGTADVLVLKYCTVRLVQSYSTRCMPRTYCHRDVDDILSGYTFNDRVRSADLNGQQGSTPVNDRQ